MVLICLYPFLLQIHSNFVEGMGEFFENAVGVVLQLSE